MPGSYLCKPTARRAGGFALVIVLLFVVLIVGLVLAFISQSMTAHQISYSSLNETKASVLAGSAEATIIGDLKQEIIDGSTATTPAAGQNVYTPLSNFNAKPALAGFTPTYTTLPAPINTASMPAVWETDGLANLIKRSASGVPFYTSSGNAIYNESGPARACSVNSTTPSISGVFVSAATWNSHFLIAQQTLTSTTDSTPVAAFTPPDWVMVARDGSNPTTFSAGVKNALVSNNQFVVGRYAYAIYDEGGLLNVNAAGYPAANTLTPLQVASNKNSPALADLSQLPASISTPVTGTTTPTGSLLTAQQINNIVGWRNYASAGLNNSTGAFGNVSFTTTSATSWLNNFVSNPATGFYNTNSFMNVVAPPGAVQANTDQAFLSRQQLIELTQSLQIPPSALQYLSTFSRALEQPSYSPDPNRPMVIGTMAPPVATSADSYQGNNDGYGGDKLINPPFLSVRVASAFTRWNGIKAVVGEPLVKTKFALSWLPMVAYNATNTSLNAPYASTGSDPDPIYDRFGLKRTSNSSPWVYNHGASHIMTLSEVAAATPPREPDFAELLKAAITVGSLAKGGPNLHNNQGNYQYTIDTSVDYNILQIMANLIDQSDTDSYPTQIQMTDSNNVAHVFSGVEDLPYFYRYHLFMVTSQLPQPLISDSASPKAATPVTVPGEGDYMYIPEIWNPHDPTTTQTTTTKRPAQFRIIATTQDPLQQTPAWSIVLNVNPTGTNSGMPPITSTPTVLSAANTAMTFKDNNGQLFREPTLLWKQGIPINSNLTAVATATKIDANTPSRTWVGILAGTIPLEVNDSSGNCYQILPSQNIDLSTNVPAGAYQQITFDLQYQDPNNPSNWISYDVKYPDLHGLYPPSVVINPADYSSDGSWASPLQNNQLSDHAVAMDPRTARFGVATEDNLGLAGPVGGGGYGTKGTYSYEPRVAAFMLSDTTAANAQVGASDFTIIESERARGDVGDVVNYSNPGMTSDPGQNQQMRWFSGVGFSASNGSSGPNEWDGLFSQNNPSVNTIGRSGGTAQIYYEDADGIARRAMGAYATVASAVVPSLATAESKTIYPGLPMAQANVYALAAKDDDTAAPFAQSQSRPLILNRAFRSVAEMSYSFRGTPWKNIDFFTPESGDCPLLDVFCVNEPPATAVAAGKVDLNTRQEPVLQAMIAGATLDEEQNFTTPPTWAFTNPVTPTDAQYAASRLLGITSDTTDAWRGPLENVSGLVGRYVAKPGTTGSALDQYTFNETVTGTSYTYAGWTGALDQTVYNSDTTAVSGKIQRFHEAALRPLADQGQTRVWNLLIDVVAQTGRYPITATALNQFLVEGEKHVWLHVAIDRMTGQVIDEQVENVSQ